MAADASGSAPRTDGREREIAARWEAASTGQGYYSVGDAVSAAMDRAPEDIAWLLAHVAAQGAALTAAEQRAEAAERDIKAYFDAAKVQENVGHAPQMEAANDPEKHVAEAKRYGYSPDPWAVEILKLRKQLNAR